MTTNDRPYPWLWWALRVLTAVLGGAMMLLGVALVLALLGIEGPLMGLLLLAAGVLGVRFGWRRRG